ncbi:hypothetical protein Dimus_028592 [Dionaea muscipula]
MVPALPACLAAPRPAGRGALFWPHNCRRRGCSLVMRGDLAAEMITGRAGVDCPHRARWLHRIGEVARCLKCSLDVRMTRRGAAHIASFKRCPQQLPPAALGLVCITSSSWLLRRWKQVVHVEEPLLFVGIG